ncbi:MAG: hypothetical protein ACLGIR_05735 [Actinomycetes bacterium]
MKKLMSSLALSSAGLLLVAGPASAAHEGAVYTAQLSEVGDNDTANDPTGSGSITVSQDGETMTVKLDASGLPDFPHAMHIHGDPAGDGSFAAASCPTTSADTNDDGKITVIEGAPAYGGIQVSLTETGDTSPDSGLALDRFPAGTTISYERSGIPIPDDLKPNLGKVHFVVHGADFDGDGELDPEPKSTLNEDFPEEGTLPLLCGTLTVQASGAVQTGAGGAATSSSDSGLMLAGGALALAGLGLGLRRRGEVA